MYQLVLREITCEIPENDKFGNTSIAFLIIKRDNII